MMQGELQLAFDLQCNPHQMAEFAVMLNSMADAPTVVIDHLGLPQLRDAQDEQTYQLWREGLHALSRCSNTYLKLSMLTYCFAGSNKWWDDAPLTNYVREKLVLEALSIFGASRCMWATNWPVDLTAMTSHQQMRSLVQFSSGLDDDRKRCVFATSARNAYQLDEHIRDAGLEELK
jgi:L-fuconolactonase